VGDKRESRIQQKIVCEVVDQGLREKKKSSRTAAQNQAGVKEHPEKNRGKGNALKLPKAKRKKQQKPTYYDWSLRERI